MYRLFRNILLLSAGLLLLSLFWGCASEEIAVDMDPPAVVQITPRSDDDVFIETGIDAVPDGDYIYLSWTQSGAHDLEGYRIYRMMDEDDAERILIDEIDPEYTEYEDRDSVLAPDQASGLSTGFSYWVTAYDESGNESGLSEETYYKLMMKPDLTEPQVQNDSLYLSWSYDFVILEPVEYFVVRLYRSVDTDWIPFWLTVYNLPSPLQVVYPEPLEAGTYKYQVDVIGATSAEQPSGSERAYQFYIP